jgi:hypothetical protein
MIFDGELGAPKRMLHPRAAQLVQVHAHLEILAVDLFQHAIVARSSNSVFCIEFNGFSPTA